MALFTAAAVTSSLAAAGIGVSSFFATASVYVVKPKLESKK